MRKLLLAAVLATLAPPALAPAPATAQIMLPDRTERAPDEGRRRDGEPTRRLFISPSGEPFRGGDGLAAWLAGADANHDGAVTLDEFQADALRVFRLYDTNGDGVIDGFEVQAYERDRVPEISEVTLGGGGEGPRGGRRGGRRGGQGGGGRDHAPRTVGAGQQGAARYSLLNEPEPLLAADADVDGKVSLAEWTKATARRFAVLDKAHTGRLTLESLRPTPSKK